MDKQLTKDIFDKFEYYIKEFNYLALDQKFIKSQKLKALQALWEYLIVMQSKINIISDLIYSEIKIKKKKLISDNADKICLCDKCQEYLNNLDN